MRDYTIKTVGCNMVIIDRTSGNEVAKYRLTPGCERAEIAAMRRELNKHLDNPGATLGNYQA